MDYKNLLVGGSQTTPSSQGRPPTSASTATVSSSAESCPEPSIPCVYPLQGPDLEAINNIVKSKLSSGSSRNYLLSGMQGWVWYKHPENETLMYEYNKIQNTPGRERFGNIKITNQYASSFLEGPFYSNPEKDPNRICMLEADYDPTCPCPPILPNPNTLKWVSRINPSPGQKRYFYPAMKPDTPVFVILNDDSMEKIVPGFVREINFKNTPQYSKGTVQVRFWGKDQNHTDFTDKNNVLPENIFYGFGCQVLVWESVSDQRHNAVSKGSRWSPSRDIIGDIRINSLPSQKGGSAQKTPPQTRINYGRSNVEYYLMIRNKFVSSKNVILVQSPESESPLIKMKINSDAKKDT